MITIITLKLRTYYSDDLLPNRRLVTLMIIIGFHLTLQLLDSFTLGFQFSMKSISFTQQLYKNITKNIHKQKTTVLFFYLFLP
jgi:hypothetical protein